jgi:protein MpaA
VKVLHGHGRPTGVVVILISACAGLGCAVRREPANVALITTEVEPLPEAAAAPGRPVRLREIVIGSSVRGQPIMLHVFGGAAAGAGGATGGTLVVAAIHGDEPSAVFVGHMLVEYLREHPEQVGAGAVGVIDLANPDGVATRTRTNANGVDCNRNFPARNWRATPRGRLYAGPAPVSEPETRAVIEAMAMLRPSRVVSIHSPLRCNNYDGPAPARELAQLMARHNSYPVQPSVGYATPGSFGSWAGTDQRVPVVTLELPPRTPGERAWQENREALLAVLRAPQGQVVTQIR